jgi:hypothetical protein
MEQNGALTKKQYRKTGLESYKLAATFQKQTHNEPWYIVEDTPGADIEKTTWEATNWTGFNVFNATNVWTYNNDIYVSDPSPEAGRRGTSDYILNKETGSWEAAPFTWNETLYQRNPGITTPVSYKHDLYRLATTATSGRKVFILNKETNVWEVSTMTLDDFNFTFDAEHTFTDGKDIYGTNGSAIYKHNKETDMWDLWRETIWNETYAYVDAALWFYKGNIYYSMGSDKQYILNKDTNTWEKHTWNGFTDLYRAYFWTDGVHMYYSDNYDSSQYVLDIETNTWKVKNWINFPEAYRYRYDVWSDGENIYISSGKSVHYKLV